jgi:hypothetical protein
MQQARILERVSQIAQGHKVEAAPTKVILAHVSHVSQNAMTEGCQSGVVDVGGSAIQVKPM